MDFTTLVVFISVPVGVPVAVTFRLKVQVAPGRSLPFVKVIVRPNGGALIVAPQSFGGGSLLVVDMINPVGKSSVNRTPVSVTGSGTFGGMFGLVSVNVKVVLLPAARFATPNVLMIVGLMGPTTHTEAGEVLPGPPFADVTLTLLFLQPVVVPVTLTEKVQIARASRVAPVRFTNADPGTAVIMPPPQDPVNPFGVDTTSPSGSVSPGGSTPIRSNAIPVRVVDGGGVGGGDNNGVFGLAIVKVSFVTPLS